MIRKAIGYLAVVALTAGCDSATTAPPPGVPAGSTALQVLTVPDSVAQHLYSGIKDRRRLVIRDMVTWTQLWNEATQQRQPRPPVPQVDFTREVLIVASMGSRPTGGYSIDIPNVYESGGQRYVVVREVSPGAGCVLTQALTAPVIAVRVSQHAGSTSFVEEPRTRPCT
ncbi:MAG: protease complex subunit PrcB family protein [Gemmatimonadota bacterium]